MPKAILELEMPESCTECPCKGTDVWGMVRCRLIHMKSDKYSGMAEGYAYKRRTDCPLKLADGDCRKAEWVNGKCRGFQVSRWDDEPIEKCKNCKDFEEYKGVEQE